MGRKAVFKENKKENIFAEHTQKQPFPPCPPQRRQVVDEGRRSSHRGDGRRGGEKQRSCRTDRRTLRRTDGRTDEGSAYQRVAVLKAGKVSGAICPAGWEDTRRSGGAPAATHWLIALNCGAAFSTQTNLRSGLAARSTHRVCQQQRPTGCQRVYFACIYTQYANTTCTFCFLLSCLFDVNSPATLLCGRDQTRPP